ncbi:MAG: glycosyltransferase domain-containing protein [Alphaproteobacteria bacterium]
MVERSDKSAGSLRKVVYTCLFGDYERFNDFEYERSPDIDFVLFTDDPDIVSRHWKTIVMPRTMLDPARAVREIKTQPHRFLAGHDWSLFIDNTVRLKAPPREIFEEYLANADSPYVCFRHYRRDCVYAEADVVKEWNLDDPARVDAQMNFYRGLGYPAHNGLAKNAFILRRHHEGSLPKIMDAWFQQILLWSRRDQLSLNPTFWFFGFSPTYLPLRFADFELLEWPARDSVRIPKDFVEADHARRHPESAGRPRRHYLYEWAPRHLEQATGRDQRGSDQIELP